MLCSVFFVFLLLLLYLYLRWMHMKFYWANLNVPHETPNPIYGSLSFFMRKSVFAWLTESYEKFHAPYFGIWLLWKPALVVNSPKLAHQILLKDSDVFRNRLMKTAKTDFTSKSLVFIRDSGHTILKRHLNPAYTASRISSFQNVLGTKSRQLVQRVSDDTKKGKLIDLRNMFSDYTTDVFSITSLGIAGEATLTGDSPMRQITKEYMKFDFVRNIAWGSVTLFPEIADLFRFDFLPKEAVANLKKVFKLALDQRKRKEYETVRDLLYYLIKMKEKSAENHEDVDDDMLLAQVAIFLQAGYDTAALSLTHAIYELAFDTNIQEKLYEEVKVAKDKTDGKEFDSQTLSELVYLNCVIQETFRKHPPLPLLDRVASEDYKIDENVTITKETPVFINVVAIHYDPEMYPNPETFDPDRFLPENQHKSKQFTLLPFGEGPRNCIGKRLGLQMLQYALTELIFHFEIRPLPNSPKPAQCEYAKKFILLSPDSPRIVNFVPRI